MRYMLLIYTSESDLAGASPEEGMSVAAQHRSVMEEAGRRGILEGAEPLAATDTATTVRRVNGELQITDGPFAETKEQLAGYYILNCENLDEAIAWASRIPTACGGYSGCVEIRPFRQSDAGQTYGQEPAGHV